jgi:ArsR family transcriptional regulator, cadmium/lead-responsive transcriptional repressor
VLTLEGRLEALNRLGRALADPTRCRLLLALLDGPAYPGQLAAGLGLTRPNVSNHLTCLRGCGLVVGTPEGRQMRYELVDRHLAHALRELLEVVPAAESPCPTGPDSGWPAADCGGLR